MAPVAWSNTTTLLRVTAEWPGDPIEVNAPTAHIWVPHWRIIVVWGLVFTVTR